MLAFQVILRAYADMIVYSQVSYKSWLLGFTGWFHVYSMYRDATFTLDLFGLGDLRRGLETRKLISLIPTAGMFCERQPVLSHYKSCVDTSLDELPHSGCET